MRIAILSDIHGNFVALETALVDVERERVDQIVCLGDVAFGGAQPREVLARLRVLRIPTVQGNTDAFFGNAPTPDPHSEAEARLLRAIDWARAKFSVDELNFLQTFQPSIEMQLEGGKNMLCFHGSPQSASDVILATTPDDALAKMLGDHHATVMTGGHTHQQMFRRFQQSIVINPGSVGMPMAWDAQGRELRPGFGEYALATSVGENLRVELRRVRLDVDAVIAPIRASGMPEAERVSAQWLNPT